MLLIGIIFNSVYLILSLYIISLLIFVSVPDPIVRISAPTTQTVGESLTLQCDATIVRGITSTLDVVWSNNSMRLNSTTLTPMDNSLLYTNSYTIAELNTTHNGSMIQCEVIVNANPLAMASNSTTLNVTGECGILVFSSILTVCMPM